MDNRIIDKEKISNIFDYVAYFEQEYGDLNYYFSSIFDGIFSHEEIMELLYCYDKINGLGEDVDMEEYEARYGNLSIEKHFEKLKTICKNVYYAMQDRKYKPNFQK